MVKYMYTDFHLKVSPFDDKFCYRLQEFIDEGVGAVKDYFQNIVFLLMSDVNGRQMITKTSVLGKIPTMKGSDKMPPLT